MSNPLHPFLKKIAAGALLSTDEMRAAMDAMLSGECSESQIAGLLMGLRGRGESVEELAAAATMMREKAVKVSAPDGAIDTCGTGGDGANTYNVSTAVALVVAGCGVPVAKHGNKAASSLSGSSQVLASLGVKLDVTPEQITRCIQDANVGFMFAAIHHSTVANVAPARAALGVRTMFNVLGPLCNPAHTKRQLMGVFSKDLLRPIAGVMNQLGIEHGWVVHGADGLDELSTTGTSFVAELKNGNVTEFEVTPEDADLARASLEDLRGGTPDENAAAITALLAGEQTAYRDIVLLNSAAALIIAGKVDNLRDGAALAAQSIDSGAAKTALKKLVQISNDVS